MNKIEPFVNDDLIKKIREIRESTSLDADIYYDERKNEEARHLSELFRIVQNYDKSEMAVCIAAILEKESDIVYTVLAEDRKSLRKGKKHDRHQ